MSSVYILTKKLPLASDIVKCILLKSPTVGSQKQKTAIKDFAKELRILWTRIFGDEFIVSHRQIERKLSAVFKQYAVRIQKDNKLSSKSKIHDETNKQDKRKSKRLKLLDF
jgi:hypothetical protein